MGGNSLGEGTHVAMGAKLRPFNVLGKKVKIGGEVKNSFVADYSNKGHEGYMGNSIIGVGCNWGANTNVSNMKNTFSPVKQWDYVAEAMRSTGEAFCGVVMGDFCRTGINTMLNTGTVMGVSTHVFGGGFPPKFVPSFSWGGAEGLETYILDLALEGADRHLGLKGMRLSPEEKEVLMSVYYQTAKYRTWEPRFEY